MGKPTDYTQQLDPGVATRCVIACLALLGCGASGQPLATSTTAAAVSGLASRDLTKLPRAETRYDAERGQLILEINAGDVPAAGAMGMYMRSLPVAQAVVPLSGTVYSITTQVVDPTGRVLPRALLHHVNVTDPTRRELFVPISLHLFAASKETPPVQVPSWLFGVPLEAHQRLLITGMVGNETPIAYHRVRFRVIIGFRPTGHLWPLWQAYPWGVDVMYPLGTGPDGSKAFDLPPGRTIKSWEGSPAVAGYVLGIGGHVHDYGTALDMVDVTSGRSIWHGTPVRDAAGRVVLLPVTRFFNWHQLGVHLEPTHTYRVSVTYDNPTGHLLHKGGMGAVAGLFVPDGTAPWPAVDPSNALYRGDLEATFVPAPDDMDGMMEAK